MRKKRRLRLPLPGVLRRHREEGPPTPVPPPTVPYDAPHRPLWRGPGDDGAALSRETYWCGMDPSLIYYLSGPMSGIEGYNYSEFERVTDMLEDAGFTIESPHRNPHPEIKLDDAQLWAYMLSLSLRQMSRCNSIILMTGWPQSRGVRRELSIAFKNNWPVFYYDNVTDTVHNMNLRKR